MIEINNHHPIETIEKEGNPEEIWGLKTAKSFRGYIKGKLNRFIKNGDKEREMMLRGILLAYNKFHPILKATINIEGFKGNGGFEIIRKPDYFETIHYQKTDDKIKKVKNRVSFYELNAVMRALKGVRINEKVLSKEIARKYCKNAFITFDLKGKPYFDENGFDFQLFSGNRSHYIPFNLCLKILDSYGVIKYFKSGKIQKLKDNFKIQTGFP